MSLLQRRFIIIEKDALVAEDMAQGFAAVSGNCLVTRVASACDLLDSLESTSVDDLTVIVTKLSMEKIETSGLAALSDNCGADIVVREGVDAADAVLRQGWLLLPAPFTEDDLADLVEMLDRRDQGRWKGDRAIG